MSMIEELQAAASAVSMSVGPATVRIGRDGGRGAGVVTADGVVVTNAHNLRGPRVTITFADGRTVRGDVRGVDADGDLTVIAADTAGVTPVAWADADAVLGTPVWAVTLPASGGTRVTLGTVSAVGRAFRGPQGRRIAGSVEHTAPLARGSSGGPLVDAAGHLVGVNTHRLGDGFYLALPADADLKRRIDELARGEAPSRRRLGVALAPAHVTQRLRAAVGLPERDGLLVRGVEDDSPAGLAGLRRGDLIVAIGDRPVTGSDDLFAALDTGAESLSVTIVRGTDELTVVVSFAVVVDEPTGDQAS
jgi:serine protease Do